ncbi:MAG: GNAT family N-acetyltransferase [Candidatus Marinimicrobia bacterium]|nr:GNAT family N-acetyltransferase [Candidatus Neomarinimicrobiota bacterium]
MFILNTSRLKLRQIHLSDADFMLELLSSPSWKEYIGDRKVNSIAEAEAYILSKVIPSYEKFGFGFYMIITRADQTRIGICGLIRRAGLEDADIGFALLPAFEGRGFALEAAQAMLDYGIKVHALERIVAITVNHNRRSITLLEKLGMNYEKMIKLPDDNEPLMLYSNKLKKQGEVHNENFSSINNSQFTDQCLELQ